MANITEQDAARLRAESLANISSSSSTSSSTTVETISSTSSSQISSSTLTATNVGQAGPNPTPSPTRIPAVNGPSLSSGAIAGVAIGAVAGIAILLAGIFFMMKRRRGAKDGQEKGAVIHEAYGSDQSTHPVINGGGGQGSWVANGKTYSGSPPSYNQQHKVELPTTRPAAELQ